VTDITGREIIHVPLLNNLSRITIDDAEPGVYIFTVIIDHEMEMHRVIIQ